ncbi:hypothetical protein SGLAM104S_02564 [Streptomyces glaucescens]
MQAKVTVWWSTVVFVGREDHVVEIVEVLGPDGTPPYRVRAENGHETIMSPGPDTVVDHRKAGDVT